jgi:iron-sulfur cluster insertion protein
MNAVAEIPAALVFTESASLKVKELIDEEGNPELKLRVFVQGGGCSGFQYGFTFDEVTNEDDTAMVKNGVTLLIDSMSYQYLVGAEIDYKDRRSRSDLNQVRRQPGQLAQRPVMPRTPAFVFWVTACRLIAALARVERSQHPCAARASYRCAVARPAV